MTIKEIRKNKPEGATHYNQSEYYFKNINGNTCEMWNPYVCKWFKTYVSVFDILKPL